jgi:hypothetical protein
MKPIKLIIAFFLLGAGCAGHVWADHGHVRFGVTIGPYWGGPGYYPPYYYAPYYPPVVVQAPAPAPQVYIEQQPVPATPPPPPAAPVAAAPSTYWYFCPAAKGYYPYVKECPGGWQKVLPQPPGQP